MSNDTMPEEWEILRDWLPEDLDARARTQQFFQRRRGLEDGEKWLRLILMHVAGGLSLEQTVLRARELGLAQVSGVALFKRCAVRRTVAACRGLAPGFVPAFAGGAASALGAQRVAQPVSSAGH
jgi:hypothetical protein